MFCYSNQQEFSVATKLGNGLAYDGATAYAPHAILWYDMLLGSGAWSVVGTSVYARGAPVHKSHSVPDTMHVHVALMQSHLYLQSGLLSHNSIDDYIQLGNTTNGPFSLHKYSITACCQYLEKGKQ